MKGLTAKQENEIIPENTILLGYRGSVAHGTYIPAHVPDTYDDKDLMGVCIASLETYFGLHHFEQQERTIEAKDGIIWDSVVYELRKYVRLLLKSNPNVLSLLWLPGHLYVTITPAGQLLIDNRHLFASKYVYQAFVGYARSQLHRMTHIHGKHLGAKRRALVEKWGWDLKNASHLIRLLRMAIEFLATGDLIVVRPDAQELIEIKKGEWPLARVRKEAQRLFDKAEDALIHSPLPAHPDKDAAEKLCVSILKEHFVEKRLFVDYG